MTDKRIHRIHLLYGIGLSVMLIISAICLMAACIEIYLSGDQPFSRESVAAAFSPIAVPVLLCLVLVFLGFILDLFLPKDTAKPVVVKQYSMIVSRMQKKADWNLADIEIQRAVTMQQNNRRRHMLISAGLLVIGSVVFLWYALQGGSFHPTDINSSVIKATAVLLPCMAVPFAYAVFAAFYARFSIKKEIALLKQVPTHPAASNDSADHILPLIRSLLLCVAVAALLYGFFSGGTADVLAKAINICTECVGLG